VRRAVQAPTIGTLGSATPATALHGRLTALAAHAWSLTLSAATITRQVRSHRERVKIDREDESTARADIDHRLAK
jgi:hypothetical protein